MAADDFELSINVDSGIDLPDLGYAVQWIVASWLPSETSFRFATNYPLVRITNNSTHHVFYARTHDHSTMGVATGSATVSTNFDVPADDRNRREHISCCC